MMRAIIRWLRDLTGGALLALAAYWMTTAALAWWRRPSPNAEPAARYGLRIHPLSRSETVAARASERT
jgi:hypothetical protein